MLSLLARLHGQEIAPEPDSPEPRSLQRIQPVEPADPISNDRIMGVIPNFQTVSDPNQTVAPLTGHRRLLCSSKKPSIPYTFCLLAAMGAALSPSRRWHSPRLRRRDGSLTASDSVRPTWIWRRRISSAIACWRRYCTRTRVITAWVPVCSIPRRVFYSLSRLVVTRSDAGHERFQFLRGRRNGDESCPFQRVLSG